MTVYPTPSTKLLWAAQLELSTSHSSPHLLSTSYCSFYYDEVSLWAQVCPKDRPKGAIGEMTMPLHPAVLRSNPWQCRGGGGQICISGDQPELISALTSGGSLLSQLLRPAFSPHRLSQGTCSKCLHRGEEIVALGLVSVQVLWGFRDRRQKVIRAQGSRHLPHAPSHHRH